jgi:hypothetical protein
MRAFLFLLAFLLKTNTFKVIDQPVRQNGASFHYHSEIIEEESKEGKRHKVFNFLKNNDNKSALSIEWGAANLKYVVDKQLRYTDPAPSISDAKDIIDPFEYPNTPIVFGNGGQNSYPASCWIERSKAPRFTGFHKEQLLQHRDENGLLIGEIKITSSYNEDLAASIVDFEVRGGADIVFKQPEGSIFDKYITNTTKPETFNWIIRRDSSLTRLLDVPSIDKQETYTKALTRWLNPRDQSASTTGEYVLCKNNTTKPSHLKLYCVGSEFEASSIRFLAVNSHQQIGTVGFASDILCSK